MPGRRRVVSLRGTPSRHQYPCGCCDCVCPTAIPTDRPASANANQSRARFFMTPPELRVETYAFATSPTPIHRALAPYASLVQRPGDSRTVTASRLTNPFPWRNRTSVNVATRWSHAPAQPRSRRPRDPAGGTSASDVRDGGATARRRDGGRARVYGCRWRRDSARDRRSGVQARLRLYVIWALLGIGARLGESRLVSRADIVRERDRARCVAEE